MTDREAQAAMRHAVEVELEPLGVGPPRCAAMAARLLATLAEGGWRLERDPDRDDQHG